MQALSTTLFLAVCGLSRASVDWSQPIVKFSGDGWNAFYEVPRTEELATTDNWITPNETNMNLYCEPDDPRICVRYDLNGTPDGILVGMLRSQITEKNKYPYDSHPMYKKYTLFGQDIYGIFFSKIDMSDTECGARILPDADPVPATAAEAIGTKYQKTICVPGMGLHFYNNLVKSGNCFDYEPTFLLYDEVNDGALVGFGVNTFGDFKNSPSGTQWYEDVPPTKKILEVLSSAPDCLADYIYEWNWMSIHIYLAPEPMNITCLNPGS